MGQLLCIYTRSSYKQGSFLQEARIAKAILFWCLFSWCFRALMLQFLQSQHQPSSPPSVLPTPCCQPRSSSLLPTSVPSSCFRSSHLPPAQIPSDTSASCCAPDCAASSAFLIPSLFPRIFQSSCFHSLSQPKGIYLCWGQYNTEQWCCQGSVKCSYLQQIPLEGSLFAHHQIFFTCILFVKYLCLFFKYQKLLKCILLYNWHVFWAAFRLIEAEGEISFSLFFTKCSCGKKALI